jgi:hypothetical protein
MKANPSDILGLGNDLDRCMRDHPDAMRSNPDLASELRQLRDKTYRRYETVSEKPRPVKDAIELAEKMTEENRRAILLRHVLHDIDDSR